MENTLFVFGNYGATGILYTTWTLAVMGWATVKLRHRYLAKKHAGLNG